MPSHAESIVWHPFRQHGLPQNIIAIDSAYGDHFQAYNAESDQNLSIPESGGMTMFNSERSSTALLTPLFDASASWWTQGLGHGSPTLSLTAAHAAGRYGHVMFASAVHEPALDLSYNLLGTLGNPKLSRVFFTDNGSTGMEVAVKMALRASCARYGWDKDDEAQPVGILGLKGSYHGDTIGVMNCSDPNVFNEKTDWYKPWGFWFTPPEIKMKKGQWTLEIPEDFNINPSSITAANTKFDSLNSVFDFPSRTAVTEAYEAHIINTLKSMTHDQKRRFGAVILEPMIMGAGGMIFVDPLFQRTLIRTIRQNPNLINPDAETDSKNSTLDWSGLPVIADEVFTGLYRLGRASSSSFWNQPNPATTSTPFTTLDLDTAPDISTHAKLLTGGLLPLALTTASDAIFQTFLSDSKTDALLHGHSYTAHPIGCSVANKSLDVMNRISSISSSSPSSTTNPKDNTTSSTPPIVTDEYAHAIKSWTEARAAWTETTPSTTTTATTTGPFSLFSPTFLKTLSNHPQIKSCFTIGTVLSLTINPKPPTNTVDNNNTVDTHDDNNNDENNNKEVSGYSSTAAASLQSRLLTTLDGDGAGIHSRVLGDVIYFMTSMVTTQERVRRLEGSILRALDEET